MTIVFIMTTEALDPGLAGYLTTNRDFVDTAVAQAVAALDLPARGRVLDMGTGAGGAIPHLVRAVGPSGQVLAVDLNPAVAALRVFPRVGFPVDADPTVRPYLESAVWPELRESAARCGTQVGLTAAELSEVERLLTPGNPQYIVDEPGFFVMHPTILATGRRGSGPG
jgi:hypothetical protein